MNETSQTVAGKTTITLYWPVSISRRDAVMYRIGMVSGSKTVASYIDNVSIYYTEKGQQTSLPGDINGDGEVNVSDVTALINKILGTSDYSDAVCDINGDGEINVSDVTALINQILK